MIRRGICTQEGLMDQPEDSFGIAQAGVLLLKM